VARSGGKTTVTLVGAAYFSINKANENNQRRRPSDEYELTEDLVQHHMVCNLYNQIFVVEKIDLCNSTPD